MLRSEALIPLRSTRYEGQFGYLQSYKNKKNRTRSATASNSTREALRVSALNCLFLKKTPRGAPELNAAGCRWPQFADAAAHSDQRNTMAMLERAFPGAIFWHNYPHMIQEMHNGVQYFDLNHCNTYTNSVLRCASQGFPRVQYIDASEFQARHPEMYLDLIHQPGHGRPEPGPCRRSSDR